MSKLNENSITRNDATAALNFPSSDTVTLETASTERLRVDSSGVATFTADVSIADKIIHTGNTNTAIRFPSANTITAETDGSERLRVDSTGRLLIGTPTSIASAGTSGVGGGSSPALQVVHPAANMAPAGISVSRFQASNPNGAVFTIQKSRNDTIGDHTVVVSGDDLGVISFDGSNGTAFNTAATIRAAVDGTPGADDMPGRLEFHTTADGAATPTEAMRIDSSGHVGIGTDSPAGLLHISGDTCQLHFTDEDDTASSRIYQSGATFAIDVDQADTKTSSVFAIRIDDAEQMKISSAGRVNVPAVYSTPIGATNRDLYVEDTGQLGYVSSTRNSKGNINPLNNVNWLYQLQPSSFNYKVRDENGELTDNLSAELEYGLIAEDVESVAPELCFYDEVDGQQELRGIHYKKLIVPLLKALQDANTKIETLETKVAALEAA